MLMITGNTGYIGSVMTRFFKQCGYKVKGLDLQLYKGCEFVEQFDPPDHQITKDIRNVNEEDLDGVTDIIHLAALSNDPLGELNQNLTYEINYKGTLKLANLAKKTGVKKFLFSSSCSMYGISDSDMPLTEDGSLNPITAYAKSKVFAERDLSQLADDNFHPVFMRNATVYGVSPMLRLGLVVNNLVAWAHTTGKVAILSDGTPWRPIIHVEDMCRAFKAVLEAPVENVHDQAFNIGLNEENYQIKDLALMVEKIVPDCRAEILNETGSDERSYRVDFSKLKEIFPEFAPQWNVEKGIDQLYKSYTENNFTLDDFESVKFFRIRWIKELIENGVIDKGLKFR